MNHTNRSKRKDYLDFDRLWQCSLGFFTVWIAHLGRRYGILQVLADENNSLPISKIAELSGKYESAIRLWCEAASALGLIERVGSESYYLPRNLSSMLVQEDSKDYLGGQFSYLALRSLDFGGFDRFFNHGVIREPSAKRLLEAFSEATKWDHTAFVEIVLPDLPRLKSILSRGARVLDIGSGTGEWDFKLARIFPNSLFVGVEPNDSAVQSSRRKAKSYGINDRVKFMRATGESFKFAKYFDLIYLGEVLCVAKSRAAILAKCFGALRSGGYLVAAEGLVSNRNQDPKSQLVHAMQLDFALQGASFLSKNEMQNLLRDSGFRSIRFRDSGGLWFTIAKK